MSKEHSSQGDRPDAHRAHGQVYPAVVEGQAAGRD